MNQRGVGDRWLAGERVEGVSFAHHQAVLVADGVHSGQRGVVLLLMVVSPEPRYLVRLTGGAGDVRLPQSALRPVG